MGRRTSARLAALGLLALLAAACQSPVPRLSHASDFPPVTAPSAVATAPDALATSAAGTAQPTAAPTDQPASGPTPRAPAATAPGPAAAPPLFDPGLNLMAGPITVPLQLLIPVLDIAAPVWGVGLTVDRAMDAPKGPTDDPAWQTAFWYRGSGRPGESGTAVLAGHIDDNLSRPALFAHLQDLVPGDAVVVRDALTGRDLSYTVTQTQIYTLAQSIQPAILARIYGAGPVANVGPQPSADGLAHLTLITCTGTNINGSFDQRLVVYAVLTP